MELVTIKQAKETGAKRYFTGKPCSKGHVSERMVSGRKCVECHYHAQKKRSANGKNKEYKRKYMSVHDNRERANRLERERRNNEEHRIKKREYQKSEKYRKYRREYQKLDRYKQRRRIRHTRRYTGDVNYRLNITCRTMLRKVLAKTKQRKSGSVKTMMGFSLDQFRQHIEKQFKDGMSWGNHGEWHVDHIVPVALMIRRGVRDHRVINNLNNLQPLWAFDNMSKKDRYEG